MDIDTAKSLYAEGFFKTAEIRPYRREFFVLVMKDFKQKEVPLTFARQAETKVYRKMNGAINDATRIGFEVITLDLTRNEAEPRQESLKLTG